MSEIRRTPLHALCVYAEPLAARRRVVVVGDASLGLDAQLVELGARTVHVYDPDGQRARAHAPRAARGAAIRELPQSDLDVRDGAYDLAIVPDLAAITDRAALLGRLRKLVGAEGACIVSSPAGSIDYYDLYDLVSLQFASVRMIGQVRFAGVALAELGESDEEPGVSVDTQLVPEPEAPEAFIALAAQQDVRLDPYTIVQLPGEGAQEDAAVEDDAQAPTEPAQHAELAAAVLRADLLATQLEEQRALTRQLTADTERAKRVDELEATLHERLAKLKEAETRAGDHYVRAERLTHDLRKLEEETQRQRDRATRLTKELEEEKRLRTRAEVDLGMVRKNPELAQARERIGILEEGLRAAEDAASVLQARAVEAERALVDAQQHFQVVGAELAVLRAEAAVPRIDAQAMEQLGLRAERAELRSAAMEAQLVEVGDAQAQELAALEVLLRQRGQAINALEQELLRRESIVRELIEALEEARVEGIPIVDTSFEDARRAEAQAEQAAAHASALAEARAHAEARANAVAAEAMREVRDHLASALEENAGLRARLDALALEVARREGELHTRTWRIAELEEQLAAQPVATPAPAPPVAPAPPPPDMSADINVFRSELDALRQALTQEHEARVRAESGEELTRARADLARQATLLEQLGRELDARDRARATGQVHEETQG